jgi:hypothetical protein
MRGGSGEQHDLVASVKDLSLAHGLECQICLISRAFGCTREEHLPACSAGSRPGKTQSPGMGGTSRLATTTSRPGISSNNESGDDSRESMLSRTELSSTLHHPAPTALYECPRSRQRVWRCREQQSKSRLDGSGISGQFNTFPHL